MVFPRSPDHDEFELGPTTHEARAAWRLEATEVKGGVPTLTVDAELGLVLSAERAAIGAFRSWSQVRTDVDLGDDRFRYDGPWRLDAHYTYPVSWLPE